MGIEDEWAAYQFDAACLVVGRAVENASVKGEDIHALLDGKPGQPEKKRFRNVRGLVKRKMKIPKSGVW